MCEVRRSTHTAISDCRRQEMAVVLHQSRRRTHTERTSELQGHSASQIRDSAYTSFGTPLLHCRLLDRRLLLGSLELLRQRSIRTERLFELRLGLPPLLIQVRVGLT